MLFSYTTLGDNMAKKVVIDAGHGGADSGAVGNGIIEKDLTLAISKYMFDRFNDLGVPVKLSRSTDETLSPDIRPKRILNQFGNSSDVIVVSNHINAGGGEGAEVIYALRNNPILASRILSELSIAGQVPRKVYQRKLINDPTKDYYYIIRNTPNNETLIVEYGFLDNPKDAEKLKRNYKDYAEGVVKAITEYAGYKYDPIKSPGEDTIEGSYIVKKGDTLWSIARRFGLSVDKLKEINNLTSNNLSIGDVLIVNEIPKDDVIGDVYIVAKGDTLYSIARKYGVSVTDLKRANNLDSNILSIGQQLVIPGETNTFNYEVKKGDTLYGISKRYNVSVDEIKRLNNLSNNILSIGQILTLPK